MLHRNKGRIKWLALAGLLAVCPVASADDSGTAAKAEQGPQPGQYCPSADTLYMILEETATALNELMQAEQALLVFGDAPTADIALGRAGAALALAAGRGSAARTAALIDAAMASKRDDNPKGMLTWFPLLRTAMATLADDATAKAASAQLDKAEAILQSQSRGEEVPVLRTMRQLLVCDPLDIPLQQAGTNLTRLRKQIMNAEKPPGSDFTAVADRLISALTYGLQRLQGLTQ